ncbi:MAG TPA: LptF/LptG family permease, partial [Methylocella sp.]|nr:LptF/LptG family permease [Methylocella sp.]
MIGWTLSFYLSTRFLLTVAAVFLLISGMIYIVDFIELLHRGGNVHGISAGYIAYLSLLRLPSISEQILPFAVLFGGMATFLILSRKLELLIARAVGVSVWGLLLPPLAIAAVAGITSAALLNPLHAIMKNRADRIEAHLFGRGGAQSSSPAIWAREKSIDGEAFIKAAKVSPDGALLTSVMAYVYDASGQFEHRVEAASGVLLPGLLRFGNAKITAPAEEAFAVQTYLLASTLSRDELLRDEVSPESVPFWELPRMRAAADAAGLESAAYELQFQILLARPLLLAAMVLIAAAFSLRFFRFGGIEKMILGGAGAGFVLYGATKFVG